MIDSLVAALPLVLDPGNLLLVCLGALLGTTLGALPGISATLAIALLIPVTFGMTGAVALMFLGGIYCGAIYGGSISAILINVPGTPGAIATVLDGYALTRKGEAGTALGAAATASFFGGMVGIFVLLFAAPLVAGWALGIGSREFFWIVIFAMTSVGALGTGSVVKGLISAALGLLLGVVGVHSFTGTTRFTFGTTALYEGIPVVVALVGLFSISEVIRLSEGRDASGTSRIASVGSLAPGFWAVIKRPVTTLKSALIGTFTGTLPGAGADIASLLGYNEARRSSRSQNFGKGEVEGVVASETANNAVVGGSLIPMLTLGIPGNAVTSALLGGLLIHGLIPGPRLFQQASDVLYPFMLSLIVANAAFLVFAFTGLRYAARIVLIPTSILAPAIVVLTIVGAIVYRGAPADIAIAIGFGLFGYLMIKTGFPLPPIVLGIILGPLAEQNLERSLTIADARSMNLFEYFVSSPVSVAFILLSVLSVGATIFREIGHRRRRAAEPT